MKQQVHERRHRERRAGSTEPQLAQLKGCSDVTLSWHLRRSRGCSWGMKLHVEEPGVERKPWRSGGSRTSQHGCDSVWGGRHEPGAGQGLSWGVGGAVQEA